MINVIQHNGVSMECYSDSSAKWHPFVFDVAVKDFVSVGARTSDQKHLCWEFLLLKERPRE